MIQYHRVKAIFEYLVKDNFSVIPLIVTDQYRFTFSERNSFELSNAGKELLSLTYSVIEKDQPVSEITFHKNGIISGFKFVGSELGDGENKDYLYGNDLLKYVNAFFKENHFQDKSAFKESITVREMPSIQPGANPYHHDSIRMGCDIGQNWQAMFHTAPSSEEDPKPSLNELVLINTKTGRRFHLDLTMANEPVVVQEEKEKSNNTICSKIVDEYRLVRD